LQDAGISASEESQPKQICSLQTRTPGKCTPRKFNKMERTEKADAMYFIGDHKNAASISSLSS